jgi:hypothetical protein
MPLTVITRFFVGDNRPHGEKYEMGFFGRKELNEGVRKEHRTVWELACLRCRHLGVSVTPQ